MRSLRSALRSLRHHIATPAAYELVVCERNYPLARVPRAARFRGH
jgi:hypothetical protein